MSKIGNMIKERKDAEKRIATLNSTKISIEDALEFEPNLLKFLRKEYEGHLSIGKISSKTAL
jgi:hypothetical protein